METVLGRGQGYDWFNYFDPTYEAWKLFNQIQIIRHDIQISILPTRHGNEKKMTEKNKKRSISILPTRHGNSACLHDPQPAHPEFRSYLRGMET